MVRAVRRVRRARGVGAAHKMSAVRVVRARWRMPLAELINIIEYLNNRQHMDAMMLLHDEMPFLRCLMLVAADAVTLAALMLSPAVAAAIRHGHAMMQRHTNSGCAAILLPRAAAHAIRYAISLSLRCRSCRHAAIRRPSPCYALPLLSRCRATHTPAYYDMALRMPHHVAVSTQPLVIKVRT